MAPRSSVARAAATLGVPLRTRYASALPPGVLCFAGPSRDAATAVVVLSPPVSPAALRFALGRWGAPAPSASLSEEDPLAGAPRGDENAQEETINAIDTGEPV